MGIIDKFGKTNVTKPQEADKITVEKVTEKFNSGISNPSVLDDKEIKIITSNEANASILEALEQFSKNYDTLNNESRMMRIQKTLHRKIFKLKLQDVSSTEFLNFAIHYVLSSKDLDTIIKFLKKPK